jgi:DNA mismatch repair ATPase MutL
VRAKQNRTHNALFKKIVRLGNNKHIGHAIKQKIERQLAFHKKAVNSHQRWVNEAAINEVYKRRTRLDKENRYEYVCVCVSVYMYTQNSHTHSCIHYTTHTHTRTHSQKRLQQGDAREDDHAKRLRRPQG